jgi:serine phosphatase RsbU (regulator of sigma subunit)
VTPAREPSAGEQLARLRPHAAGEPFDRLAALAERLLGVPLALVAFADAAALLDALGRDVVTAPEPVVIHDAAADPRLAGREGVGRAGIGAYAGHPLRGADGDPVGAFCALDVVPRAWSGSHLALLADLAALAQHELDLRAARDTAARGRTLALMEGAEHEHVARTLVAALQPESLPELHGVRLVGCYEPAESRLGGDWYDAFRLADGTLGVAIGDVVGHGIDAAAQAVRLRRSLRGAVLEGFEPGVTLKALNAEAVRTGDGMAGTMLYATLDPHSRRLRWASAGHLPPIVAESGAVRRLAAASRPPLGAIAAEAWTEEEVVLEPGARVVLYTDGLIERRDELIDHGIDRLARATLEQPELEAVCEAALAAAPRPRRDDIAVVALELS